MKTITKEDSNTILLEMFRRVGLTKKDYESWDFSEPRWYEKKTWTIQDQDDFQHWLGDFFQEKKYVGKRKYRGQHHGRYEAGKFILNYGWKATLSVK